MRRRQLRHSNFPTCSAGCYFLLILLGVFLTGSCVSSGSRFYGETSIADPGTLRYISGSEPESLDPAIPSGQPEARLLIALYDGLVEYHPKTMEPIPAIAERWQVSEDGTEYTFFLRKGARFSNGRMITAKDFEYSIRRGFSPELASKNAKLAYYIKNSEAYNSGKVFAQRLDGSFILEPGTSDERSVERAKTNFSDNALLTERLAELRKPQRLTLPSNEDKRAEFIEKNPELLPLLIGAKFIPVAAEDIGVEAVDDRTLRFKLNQPAPFFLGLLAHQFFRVVDKETVEKFGKDWTRVENIVTSGAFLLKEHHPYDRIIVEKNPGYWDAEMVRLKRIEFYPLEEATTMMNLYKSGSVDAVYNHVPPAAWVASLRKFEDEYLDFPEVAIEYYTINVTKPPMDKLKVRQAFALAIDRETLSKFRQTTQPLIDFTPEGIFPEYEKARQRVYREKLAAAGSSLEEWKSRVFDPEKARRLLEESGFPVLRSGNGYSCPTFPVDQVDLTYNTSESNKATAEFIQAQWKQNLGITIPLKNMEFRTWLSERSKLNYNGFGRAGWVGDYMDPNTFLNLFYTSRNDSSTGWYDARFDQLIDASNRELNESKRFELMAEAELLMMQGQPVIPLQTQATNWVKKPYVKGLYPNPGTLHSWKFVYIETDPSKWDRDVRNIMNSKDEWVYRNIDRLNATTKSTSD